VLRNESRDAARLLVDCGADIERLDNNGRTALLHALEHTSFGMCSPLLDHGANIDHQDNFVVVLPLMKLAII
jgi:ankyrin repeat protein